MLVIDRKVVAISIRGNSYLSYTVFSECFMLTGSNFSYFFTESFEELQVLAVNFRLIQRLFRCSTAMKENTPEMI